ncbi:esterase/lipase family protein [Nocardia sp. CWNU-33]|uniref:esterase/lipase family protein n=1 Tax=Nocardia sp. CWNU-33 TaxID=3392117 RepID=UPI00398E3367
MLMLARIVRLAVVMACVAVGSVAGHAAAAPAVGRNPVLVIGGYDADQGKLESLRTWLGARGYPAYSMVLLGNPTGTAAIVESARAVADKVAEIRRETGAVRVDLAGHSMGGLAQRHYAKFLGGSDQVGIYVDFGTPELGEPLGWLCSAWSQGCRDLAPGSEFLTELNADPAVPPGLPAYHLFTEGAGGETNSLPGATNRSIQSFCPGRQVGHADEPVDGAVRELIDSALRGGPLTTSCP